MIWWLQTWRDQKDLRLLTPASNAVSFVKASSRTWWSWKIYWSWLKTLRRTWFETCGSWLRDWLELAGLDVWLDLELAGLDLGLDLGPDLELACIVLGLDLGLAVLDLNWELKRSNEIHFTRTTLTFSSPGSAQTRPSSWCRAGSWRGEQLLYEVFIKFIGAAKAFNVHSSSWPLQSV